MTSRQRVLTAFAHQEPDRVPIWCDLFEEFKAKAMRELEPGKHYLFSYFELDGPV